jgi:hypothetical protein
VIGTSDRANTESDALVRWLKRIDTSGWVFATLTMRQTVWNDKDGYRYPYRLDRSRSTKNMSLFRNRLDAKVLQNQYRKQGRRLGIVPFIERKDGRYHYHVGIERPTDREIGKDLEVFERVIRECWEKTPFGWSNIDVRETYSNEWIGYGLKVQSGNWNELDVENLYIPRAAKTP